jgi:hypothetical protein
MSIKLDDLLDKISGTGVLFTVAGGYPRDLIHGKVPKDLDICVYKDGLDIPATQGHKFSIPRTKLYSCLELMGAKIDRYENGDHESGIEYDDTDILEVWKCTIPDYEYQVDIIFYDTHVKTVADLMDCFDSTFSQYILHSYSGVWTPCYRGDTPQGVLLQAKEFVSPTRMKYISEKALTYGWSVNLSDGMRKEILALG